MPGVVLSSTDDRGTVLAAVAAGAAGFMPKASSNDVMLSALRLVLAAGKYLPAEALARDEGPRAGKAASVESLGLSPRQRGKRNKTICDELGLASSRTQAALAAARLGLGAAPTTGTS